MRAARYYGPEDVRVEEVEPDTVGSNDVRVEIAACGICGSDLGEYVGGPITIPDEPHPVTGERLPITIGHEMGGTVTEVGESVDIDVGTHAVVNPIIWCGECRYCDEGEYRLCESGGFIGLSGGGGGFAENIVVSAEKIVPVPDGIPAHLAALVEPFTVGVHAVQRSGLGAGDSVAVFGSGPIGLTVVQAAVAAGANPVFVSEPKANRRSLAKECGADEVIDPTDTNPVETIRKHTDGGADVSFEVAGVEPSVNQSLAAVKSGGTTTIVSIFEETIDIDPNDIVMPETTVVGTAAYRGGPLSGREFGTTMKNFATGAFDPTPLVTSEIELENIVRDGFERLLDGESEEIKILVRP
ncbi:2,3-butanediol dehydrogenase [Haladaptatus sp. DYF46]|uniref:2,3-butanediol dehydrogenase n=1 Tax=Haladaptatus sp. DYF46 TaxID=2886041 RepID=UPI001E318D44|nr:2,3-butanediol dehydrogenase [Haladaptatus sp. DYF46]